MVNHLLFLEGLGESFGLNLQYHFHPLCTAGARQSRQRAASKAFHRFCRGGKVPAEQPGWTTLCYSLELVLVRGKCPSSQNGGLGSTMLQTRGGFDFSSCGGIRFLENPLPCSSNFRLKQLLLTHLPTPVKLLLAPTGERARVIVGFEGNQKVSDCRSSALCSSGQPGGK